jgi:hypothetical protein
VQQADPQKVGQVLLDGAERVLGPLGYFRLAVALQEELHDAVAMRQGRSDVGHVAAGVDRRSGGCQGLLVAFDRGHREPQQVGQVFDREHRALFEGLARKPRHQSAVQCGQPLAASQVKIPVGAERQPDFDHAALPQRLAGGLVDGHGMKQNLPGRSGLVAPEASEDECILTQRFGRPRRQMILRTQMTGDKTFQRLARLTIKEVKPFHQNPLSWLPHP